MTVQRRQKFSSRPSVVQNQDCLIKAQCQSCKFINLDYKHGLKTKFDLGLQSLKQSLDLSQTKILSPTASPRPLAYRSYSKLAVRPLGDEIGIGLFAPGTHNLVDICSCPLHAPGVNALLVDLKLQMKELGLSPFDEKNKSGDIRYLTVRVNRSTQAMALLLVCYSPLKTKIQTLAKNLRSRHKLSSVTMNINSEDTNRIFGKDSEIIWGHAFLENFCGLDFEFGPTSFSQVNYYQAELLYRRVEQLVGPASRPGEVVWDLYCGVGPMAAIFSRLGYSVVAIEENPEAILLAQGNFRRNDLKGPAHLAAGTVSEQLETLPSWGLKPSMILLNPSRRGVEEEARWKLGGLTADISPRLLYVSCDLDSFLRDAKDFIQYGFKLRQVECFDMFAQTDKLEWLSIFTKDA